MTQTAREVVDGLMRGNQVERMGYWENIWGQTLHKWRENEGYPVDEEGVQIPPSQHFDMDLLGAGGAPFWQPRMDGGEVLEETDEWVIKRNGAGAALKTWKDKAGTPEHIDFEMTSRDIWENKYRPLLLETSRDRVDIPKYQENLKIAHEADKAALTGHPFVWEILRQSLGDVCMYESLALDPDWIHDFCRVYTDFFKNHMDMVFREAGAPDVTRVCEDMGYKNSLFCSPDMLDELIFPYFRELIEFYHAWDVPVLLHSCGCVEEALPLIMDAGFDGLDPMEIRAGCDPLKFADQVGDKIMLRGGFDKTVLENGDRREIEENITNLVEGMKTRGIRYMFSTDHSVSTNVDYQDYWFALNVFREHMYYT